MTVCFILASVYFSGDILEIGVQWSVQKGDIESFQRYMAQLKPYYFDYRFVNIEQFFLDLENVKIICPSKHCIVLNDCTLYLLSFQ